MDFIDPPGATPLDPEEVAGQFPDPISTLGALNTWEEACGNSPTSSYSPRSKAASKSRINTHALWALISTSASDRP